VSVIDLLERSKLRGEVGGGAEFIILECVPSVKKMFFHAKQALHTSHITRTQFRYFITRDCACLNC
jgi:hypothetical protein